MRLELSPTSRVHVDVRSKTLVRAFDHEVTFWAPPEPWQADVEASPDGRLAFPIHVRIATSRFVAPEGASAADRAKMIENLRGPEVLDAGRWPFVEFRGRYEGGLEQGELSGEVVVRGGAYPWRLSMTASETGEGRRVRGAWEGALGALGLKPFRALFGAVRLADWLRVRLDIGVILTGASSPTRP